MFAFCHIQQFSTYSQWLIPLAIWCTENYLFCDIVRYIARIWADLTVKINLNVELLLSWG